MMSNRVSCFAVGMLAALLFATSLASAGEVLSQTGRGLIETHSKIKKKEVMAVRAQALRVAQQQAVWKAILALGIDEVILANRDLIESDLLPTAPALVSTVQVVDEIPGIRSYEVVARITVDREHLVAELDALGIAVDLTSSRMSVAIVIKEFFKADEAPESQRIARELHISDHSASDSASFDYDATASADLSASGSYDEQAHASALAAANGGGGTALASGRASASATGKASLAASRDASVSAHAATESEHRDFDLALTEYFSPADLKMEIPDPYSGAAIAARMIASDIRLIEGGSARSLQQELASGGTIVNVMADASRLGESAVSFGQKYGADALLVGVTTVTYDGLEGDAHAATANVAVRVVDAATGDVIASATRGQAALGHDAASAAAGAGRRVGEVVGEDIRRQLVEYWQRRAERGWELTIQLIGSAAPADGYAIERVLGAVPGVVRVEQRFADAASGVVELVITTKESPRVLRRQFAEVLSADPSTRHFADESTSGGLWRLRVP